MSAAMNAIMPMSVHVPAMLTPVREAR
jgi:hypothetical protein